MGGKQNILSELFRFFNNIINILNKWKLYLVQTQSLKSHEVWISEIKQFLCGEFYKAHTQVLSTPASTTGTWDPASQKWAKRVQHKPTTTTHGLLRKSRAIQMKYYRETVRNKHAPDNRQGRSFWTRISIMKRTWGIFQTSTTANSFNPSPKCIFFHQFL